MTNKNQDLIDRLRKIRNNCNAEFNQFIAELEKSPMLNCPKDEKNDAPLHVRETYTLAINDHFDKGVIDSTIWDTATPWQRDPTNPNNVTNNEEQWYVDTQDPSNTLPSPFSFGSSTLDITATYAPGNGTGSDYLSGTLVSAQRHHYGYYEQCQWVPCGCAGLWAAFWLYHWSVGEIDIAEWVEGPGAGFGGGPYSAECQQQALHTLVGTKIDGSGYNGGTTQDCNGNTYDANNGFTIPCDPTICGRYSTVGVDWCPDRLTYYKDGQTTNTVCDPALIPQEPMYIFSNLAVGGNFPGFADPSCYPKTYSIDYIRYYRK